MNSHSWPRFLFALLALMVAPALTVAAADLHDTAWAIAERETHNRDDARPGKAGERTRFHIKPDVWRQYSDRPFITGSRDPAEARRVALAHLAWIADRLRVARRPVDAYWLALIWNAGVGNFWRGTIPRSSFDYAADVAALAETRSSPTVSPAEPDTLVALNALLWRWQIVF